MKLVAITGSIGCGKTTLAKIIKNLGYAVFDIDAWVRTIYNNKEFLSKLSFVFPESIKDGCADKRYLRKIVFSDKNKLEKLEGLIYPFLNQKIRQTITKKAKDDVLCFLDAALLFEKGWDKYCHFVILADASYEIRKKRVMERDKVSEEDFDKINNIQLKNSDKKILSDVVIDTNKNLNLLKVDLIKIINGIEEYYGQRNCF